MEAVQQLLVGDVPPLNRGRIERIFGSYGFITTASEDETKYFFHFGKCLTRPEILQPGDEVEFVLGSDDKSGAMHAQRVRRVSPLVQATMPVVVGLTSVLPSAYWPPSPASSPNSPVGWSTSISPLIGFSSDETPATNKFDAPFPCRGLIVKVPNGVELSCRGTAAFLLGGAAEEGLAAEEGHGEETAIAHFDWSALRFPQERFGLVRFGSKVNMTVQSASRSDGTTMWKADQILPIVPEFKGRVVELMKESAWLQTPDRERLVRFPLRCNKDPSISVGSVVKFILLPNAMKTQDGEEVAGRVVHVREDDELVPFNRVESKVKQWPSAVLQEGTPIGVDVVKEKKCRRSLCFSPVVGSERKKSSPALSASPPTNSTSRSIGDTLLVGLDVDNISNLLFTNNVF